MPLGEPRTTHPAGRAVPMSKLAAKASTAPKPPKKSPKKATGARLPRPDDSEIVETGAKRLVGYARLSTDQRTAALQLDALRSAGCAVIHQDSASGASRSRPGLGRALKDLAAGDTLVVWKLDRFGLSVRDLLDVVEALRERRVALRSLTEHIDTRTAAGKMLYGVLRAVAQSERDVLRERTIAGMRAAKSRGERIGRPPALTPSQVREAKKMLGRGESANRVARVLRVGRSTLYRHLQ